MCKRILKKQTESKGDVPFYKISTFGGKPDTFVSQEIFNKYKTEYPYPNKGDVLLSAAGTIGKSVIFDGKPSYFQDSNIVWIANDEKHVLNKYLYYFYTSIKWKVSKGGTIARLYNDNIRKTPIPLLPLSEQERIVKILDKFETLVNDLTNGLPAEIEARRRQYEYYREKLLNFKEKTA
jgi:type I restriction enzyme S subunit